MGSNPGYLLTFFLLYLHMFYSYFRSIQTHSIKMEWVDNMSRQQTRTSAQLPDPNWWIFAHNQRVVTAVTYVRLLMTCVRQDHGNYILLLLLRISFRWFWFNIFVKLERKKLFLGCYNSLDKYLMEVRGKAMGTTVLFCSKAIKGTWGI